MKIGHVGTNYTCYFTSYSTDLMQRRTRMQVTVYCSRHARTPAPELH